MCFGTLKRGLLLPEPDLEKLTVLLLFSVTVPFSIPKMKQLKKAVSLLKFEIWLTCCGDSSSLLTTSAFGIMGDFQ